MTKTLYILLFLTLCATHSIAQELTIPFEFTSEDDNKLIKENDSLKYYAATDDAENTVVINEEASWYKLMNKEHHTIAEGAYLAEGEKLLQDGKWVAKYDNGKPKITGFYHRGRAVGTWEEYYNSGKLKTVTNYGIFSFKDNTSSCPSGSYQEYYPNGKLKVNGFYMGVASTYKDTTVVEDPITNKKVYSLITRTVLKAQKVSHWEYYTEDGEFDKKDDY